jgi:hypothetical protein
LSANVFPGGLLDEGLLEGAVLETGDKREQRSEVSNTCLEIISHKVAGGLPDVLDARGGKSMGCWDLLQSEAAGEAL